MMHTPFNEQRRQQFLTEPYSIHALKVLEDWNVELRQNLHRAELGLENISLEAAQLADNCFEAFSIRYTAGEPIDHLRSDLTDVIVAYEQYQQALEKFEEIPQVAPIGLGDIGAYERCIQLIGLCYLLHRRDLLPRIAALEDPAYAGEDALYEDLLAYEIEGRYDTNQMLHLEPYDHLLRAMYSEDDNECVEAIKTYVGNWYAAFKQVPWHDGHLRIRGTEGDYFGYWAFEAGVVAYVLDLDDSSIDHLVYPRDLVKWARENKHLADEFSKPTRLRGLPGEAVPATGVWRTLAIKGEQGVRHFNVGDKFPAIATTDWGAVIWYLDV